MSFVNHTSAKMPTSCNSCSDTGNSMGSMNSSMDLMGKPIAKQKRMAAAKKAAKKAEAEQKAATPQKSADNAFITLQQLRDMITEIRTGEYGSIETAEAALRKFLGGVGETAKGHLGKAIKDFVLKGSEVPLEGAGIGIRSVLLAAAGLGYGVEKIARDAHKAVSDTI